MGFWPPPGVRWKFATGGNASAVGPVLAEPARPVGPVLAPEVAAWHDVVCPEGPECRNRHVHAHSETVVTTGTLARFLERLEELRAPTSGR